MTFAVNPNDGVRLHYEIEGSGPPLVLLHGTATSSALWRQLGYVDALARDYQLVLMDMRGHGRSDKPHAEEMYALTFFVDDVVTVLDALEIEAAHHFGYSLGGRVAFGIGAHAPERAASLIIGGGSFETLPGWFDRVIFSGALEILATTGIEAFLDAWSMHLGAPVPSALRKMFLANDAKALVPYLRQTERDPSLANALPAITAPALLFAGEDDHERLEASLVAADRMPAAELVTIPGEHHLSTLAKIEKVLPHVVPFLRDARTLAAPAV